MKINLCLANENFTFKPTKRPKNEYDEQNIFFKQLQDLIVNRVSWQSFSRDRPSYKTVIRWRVMKNDYLTTAINDIDMMETVEESVTAAALVTSQGRSVFTTELNPILTASSEYWNWWNMSSLKKSDGWRWFVRNMMLVTAETRVPDAARMMSATQRQIWR